jgi:integrase
MLQQDRERRKPQRIKFTQLAVDRLKPQAESVTYWDTQLSGFGLRISPRDRRTWICMYRVGKKPVMETIGTMIQIPKVDEARKRAGASMGKAHDGVNPVEIRREAQAEEKARAGAAALTFAEVTERFLREHIERNSAPRYAAEVRRIIEHNALPRWGVRPIREIAKHDVNELLDLKAARRERKRKGAKGGAAIEANRTLTLLRTLFRWAVDMDLVAVDPTAGVRRRIKEKARDRALNDDEIRLFWDACDKIGWPFGPLFKTLLLTAQRRDEVGGMRWAELDLDNRAWVIPRQRTKSDRAHVVHLSGLATETIEALPKTGDIVFSSTGATPVSGFSRAKARLDRLMTAQLREESGDPEAGIGEWILHDLRRTATTGMAGLKIAPHVVDKILNHSTGTIRGVAAIYNRHAYLDERQAALEAWGRHVEKVVKPDDAADNVVPMKKQAKA